MASGVVSMPLAGGSHGTLLGKVKFAAFSVFHAMTERGGPPGSHTRQTWQQDALAVVLRLVEWLQVCSLAVQYGWSPQVASIIRTVRVCAAPRGRS